MTFLLSEDEALRNLLKDMVVTDQKSADPNTGAATRKVNVWFGQPDQEIRQQSYPYITIDMIDISEDIQRAMRGKVAPSYIADPSNITDSIDFDPTVHGWEIDFPIPVNIDYQITTYARQPRHDREILAQLLYTKIPLRFAVLETNDNTVRRLDVLDVSKRDVTEQGKRLFVNAFTVRVSSEIAPSTFHVMYKALQISVTGTTGGLVRGGTKPAFTPIDSFTHTAQ